MPMNVLLTNATDIFAGGEDYVLVLAKHLRARGHAVWISAQPGHLLLEKGAALGIPQVPIAYRGMDRVFAVSRELRMALRTRSIDVVHSNANYDRTCAALATAWTRTKHIAGVHSAHSIQHNLTHWVRNRFGIDHFIVDADAGRDVLTGEDHIAPGRVTTVPIGIEEPPLLSSTDVRRETRRRLGVNDSTVVIGNVARLVPFKGHRVLLDAVAMLVRENADVLVPIIGDGELLGVLQEQARRLAIEPAIRFLGFQDHLEEWYPAFDIYVHSSLEMASEMFPIAILRALAAQLPVVCTHVGGIDRMISDGVNGHVVPPDQSERLGSALLDLVRNRDRRAAMGNASGKHFHQHFRADVMAESIENIYIRIKKAP